VLSPHPSGRVIDAAGVEGRLDATMEASLVRKSLAEVAKHTMFVKILGSYPNVNG